MIDNKGRLEVRLYHGTSSMFLADIREHGLGGRRDSRLFDTEILASLAHALNDSRNHTEWWDLNSFIVELMLNQRVTDGGFNYRYGSGYLTPSKSTACRYATSNCLGSEFLTTIYRAYMALSSVNHVEAERIIPTGHCLRAAFQETHNPVLIAVENIGAEKLRTERGEPIHNQLDAMMAMRNNRVSLDPDILWQQFNFELEGSIDWQFLDVAYLNGKRVESAQGSEII